MNNDNDLKLACHDQIIGLAWPLVVCTEVIFQMLSFAPSLRSFHFNDMRIDEALRSFLETFRLPGEAPVIQHLLEHFSEGYFVSGTTWCGVCCDVLWCGMVWCGVAWYGMVWYGMVWYGMIWYGMVWYGMVWYGMVWYGMVWYGMVWCGMVWYGMVWYGMVWYGMVWYGVVA